MLNSEFVSLLITALNIFSSLAWVSSLIAWVICILRPLLIVIALSGKTQIDGCYPRETQEWRSKWDCSPQLEALAGPGVMVSLQINGNTSKGAYFYVLLLHLVIFCFFRHVPGLPAPAGLKRPIPSTKGIEKLLLSSRGYFTWWIHLCCPDMMILAGSWCAWGGFGWCQQSRLGPALCSVASGKELNYLGPVGAVLRAVFFWDNKTQWAKGMWEITGLVGRKPWWGGKAVLMWCVVSVVSPGEPWHCVGQEPQLNLSCCRLRKGSGQTNLWHQLQWAICTYKCACPQGLPCSWLGWSKSLVRFIFPEEFP